MPCCHCDSDSFGRDYCQPCWELAIDVIEAVDELPIDCDLADLSAAFPEWKAKVARFRNAYVDPEAPDPADCDLYDSDTANRISAEELGCTDQEYAAAILESLACPQPEGHVYAGNRRVYAAE